MLRFDRVSAVLATLAGTTFSQLTTSFVLKWPNMAIDHAIGQSSAFAAQQILVWECPSAASSHLSREADGCVLEWLCRRPVRLSKSTAIHQHKNQQKQCKILLAHGGPSVKLLRQASDYVFSCTSNWADHCFFVSCRTSQARVRLALEDKRYRPETD